MVAETIFQHFIFQEFILPFLLVFTIIFAVLEKTKLLGDDKKKLDAIVAFVVGLVFVTAVFPKTVISNLILFLTVAILVVFVILLVWGFIYGNAEGGFTLEPWMKWTLGGLAAFGLLFVLIWAIGSQTGMLDWIANRNWSSPFFTNLLFVIVIAVALALVLAKTKSSGGK